jgi:uncharacterized membrane protein (UPF0182 family)
VYDFPKSSLVNGPMQVESRISQDADISALITLWGQQQSQIIRGNLLVIPIDDSLLYVEPFYLEAPNSPLPQLKLVVLAYSDRIVNASTLEEALQMMFGKTDGVRRPEPAAASAPTPPSTAAVGASVKQLLQQALELDQQAQEALSNGDLAGYQAKQRQQNDLIKQAIELAQ